MTYQCPKCGGSFTVEGGVQSVQCPHCNEVVQVGVPQAQMPKLEVELFEAGPSGKSRGVAGLLAILLGGFGAHYFYCGKIGGGITFLLIIWLVSLVTCGVGAIICVVPLIQGILMFTMKQEDFENKWVNTSSFMPLF